MDKELLLVLKTRENYDRYSRFIKPSSVGETTHTILTSMGEWFKHNTEATEIEWSHFNAWVCLVRHAKMAKEKLDVLREVINNLEGSSAPDPKDIKLLLEGLITRDYASQIAEVGLRIADGDFSTSWSRISDLAALRDREIGKVSSSDAHILLPTLSGLETTVAPGLKWRMNACNQALGDLRQGNLIVVATRPDTGKTTFLASESSFMAEQLPPEKKVLWVNNEEDGNVVFRRIIQSTLAIEVEELEDDMPNVLEEYKKVVGGIDKIMMFNKADVHVRDVDHLLAKYDIGLIVFDQLWKVHGFDDEAGNEVVRQTMLFNWAREIAKKHAPVVAVHQADGSAEGVKWIDMSKLYGSKTGIQGEADAIVTIGRIPEGGNARYLYVPKNKMSKPGNPKLRNGMFEIEIIPEIGRWKEF